MRVYLTGRFSAWRARKTNAVAVVLATALLAAGAPILAAAPAGANSTTPPFDECPAVGYDSSCGMLVLVTDSATSVLTNPNLGPYDGGDDTLVGILNNSSRTVGSLALHSSTDLFGFDGDGLCTYGVSGCPFGSTGYEGPNTTFSDISPDHSSGVVNFIGGLAPGQSRYFSLEESLSGATLQTGSGQSDVTVAEQGVAPNPSEKATNCSTGQPVNCASGVFWHTFGDVAVPGRGVPLAFGRTYTSSAAALDGPLGFGWTHADNMSLSIDGSNNATVHQENGSAVTFAPNGSAYTAPTRVLATLIHNGDGTFTFTRKAGGISFVFSAAGRLVSEKDRNGYTTSLAYNGAGQLATITDPAGRTLTVGWTGSHITSVTDQASPPRTVTFSYDGSGNLSDAIDVAGGHWTFTYDAAHRMLTMRSPRFYGDTTTTPSPVITNHYDASARIDWQSDPLARTTSFAYTGDNTSSAGGTTTITDPKGNVTSHSYQNLAMLSVTRGAGTAAAATTQYSYDPFTLGVSAVTDPNGHVTNSAYDRDGNVTSVTDSLGRVTTATYNGFDEPLTVQDGDLVTTTLAYDGVGNLQSTSTPLVGSSPAVSQTTTYSYADLTHPGDVTSITDPDVKVWPQAWDAPGNLVSVTDPAGDKTQACYDSVGRQTKVIAPKGSAAGVICATVNPTYTTTISPNAFGDPLTVTDPLGHQSVVTYDANRNRLTVRDALLHTTTSTFDPAGELTVVTRPDSPATTLRYDYNPDGTVLRYTDGANHATTYGYDPLARVVSVTDPLSRATTYGYDPAGNQVTKADPSGTCPAWPITYPPTLATSQQCTVWRYDVANQPTAISYSDGVTPNVSAIGYDNDGRRTSMTDGTGTSSWVSDSLGRLTSQTNGAAQTTGYGYDLRGDNTTITYPGTTGIVTQTFDNAGRLTKVKDWANHETVFNVDADSFLTSQAYPNGTTTTNTPDGADRLMTVSHAPTATPNSPFAKFTYGRDNADQVSSVSSTGVPADTHSYAYSNLNQLTGVDATTYGYDAADNLTRLTSGATQTFDAANQLTNPGTSYDSRGNRTASSLPNGGTAGLTYDQGNRLSGLSAQNGRHTLAAGFGHTLALKTDGTVWAWGKNSSGQLGNNSASNSLVPVQVNSLTGAVDVAAGYSHSLAVKSDGTVWAWGSNAFGELGNNTLVESHVPVQVSGLTGVIAVAAGAGHSLAVKSDGTVWAWGYNFFGELGNNTLTNSKVPVQVTGLTGAVAIAAGGHSPGGHSLAVKSDGTVWSWGQNTSGQLGNNTTTNSKVPVQVTGLTGAVGVAAGEYHSLAVKSDGTVRAWGENVSGQLGNNTTTSSSVPVQVSGLPGAVAVAAGGGHSLTRKTDGTIWGWGSNGSGELGNNTITNSPIPVQATSLTGAVGLAAGYRHSLTIKTGGTVWDWGYNADGELGNNTTTENHLAIQSNMSAVTVPVTTTTYAYNGDGLRSAKTVSGTTTGFTWDAGGNLLVDGTTNYVYGPGGLPLEQITPAGVITYYHHDQLGSTRALTNSTGVVVATATYDPYGRPTGSTGTATNPFGYAGQYTDSESGLQYLRARYYDPSTGNFLSVDPAFSASGSRYGYVNGSPVNGTDPTGLITFNWRRGLRSVANYGAGIANFPVDLLSLGHLHVSAPYCDALSWAYDAGNLYGTAALALFGGGAPETTSAAAEGGGIADLSIDSAQIESKFKHAADFGVTESRGASGFDAFGKAVDSFVGHSETIRTLGTYRGNPAILNYNPLTSQVVVQAPDGAFISGWRMSAAQLQHVIDSGSLGGG